jgi:dephospho-CoA kinase
MDSKNGDLVYRISHPVLAVSGRIASGKSTLAAGLASHLGWGRASFGNYLRSFAIEQGLDPTRPTLQSLGARLVAEDPVGFARAVLEYAGWREGKPAVVDGVRHVIILDALRHILNPMPLRLIHIVVDDEVQRERLVARSGSKAEHARDLESHSTERDVRSELLAAADLVLDGTKSPEQLVEEVLKWISTICNA